ncbi:MAG: DUF2963 domain-containing protein [Vigna little leaf phytoplasma]|nr:DUF2963 domain-containing protein [Vigna little leaf phytoplasma]
MIIIASYDRTTQYKIKENSYQHDGQTIKIIFEFDKDTEKLIMI